MYSKSALLKKLIGHGVIITGEPEKGIIVVNHYPASGNKIASVGEDLFEVTLAPMGERVLYSIDHVVVIRPQS